jgi:branched-chain amino acid aminotransferase
LFVVLDGVVQTNDSRHSILPGITRDAIIEIARDLGYPVETRALTIEDLLVADEAFFTGTAAEVTPVSEVDGVKIGKGRPGEITRDIQRAFFKATSGESKRYRKWLHFVDQCTFDGAYSALPCI